MRLKAREENKDEFEGCFNFPAEVIMIENETRLVARCPWGEVELMLEPMGEEDSEY